MHLLFIMLTSCGACLVRCVLGSVGVQHADCCFIMRVSLMQHQLHEPCSWFQAAPVGVAMHVHVCACVPQQAE
jgi:hypothetical protein